jgi:putative transcriptional regulator
MIVPRFDKVLAKEKRTFYWLAKETGVSHTTLWRLKKGKAVGINFETLEKICRALKCQPGDVLLLTKIKLPHRVNLPERDASRELQQLLQFPANGLADALIEEGQTNERESAEQ